VRCFETPNPHSVCVTGGRGAANCGGWNRCPTASSPRFCGLGVRNVQWFRGGLVFKAHRLLQRRRELRRLEPLPHGLQSCFAFGVRVWGTLQFHRQVASPPTSVPLTGSRYPTLKREFHMREVDYCTEMAGTAAPLPPGLLGVWGQGLGLGRGPGRVIGDFSSSNPCLLGFETGGVGWDQEIASPGISCQSFNHTPDTHIPTGVPRS